MVGKILAGIDEAGLGPLLGPLCFGFTVFEVPSDDNLWEILSETVSQEKHPEKLAVADSKKIYPGPSGFRRIEETALAFHFALHGSIPKTLEEFLSLSPVSGSKETLDRHPWYSSRDCELPRKAKREEVEAKGLKLRANLEKAGVKVFAAASKAIPEAELNDSFQLTGNKSTTHFEKCSHALRWIVEQHFIDGGEIWIDRHGMRRRYAPLLAQCFPELQIWILRERARESYYRLEGDRGSLQVAFIEKGESKAFPVALASIFAKYTRELLMERWNDYFSKIAPGVKPTAGYYTDAQRYLSQAKECIERAQIPVSLLVRER